MKYPGPIRPEPPLRRPRKWWPSLLTLICAGAWLLLYWLRTSDIMSAEAIALAIAVFVPVVVFVLANGGSRAFFSDLFSSCGIRPSPQDIREIWRQRASEAAVPDNDLPPAKPTGGSHRRRTDKRLHDRD